MRRLLAILFLVALPCASSAAADFTLELHGGGFVPRDRYFKDIYGAGVRLGGELGWNIGRHFSLRAGIAYQSTRGELTFSGEETKLRLVPADFGARVSIPLWRFVPFLGAGVGICVYREVNPIGVVSETAVGFFVEAGTLFRLSDRVQLDVRIKYDDFRARGEGITANVGGFHGLLGIRFCFCGNQPAREVP